MKKIFIFVSAFALLALIQPVLAQTTTPTTTVSTSTSVSTGTSTGATSTNPSQIVLGMVYPYQRNLTLGLSGAEVTALQDWLIANGFDIPAITKGNIEKGYFGGQTRSALIAYQRSVGLPAFGYFGVMTRAKMNESRGASLRVTAPNGGEVLKKGSTTNITWTGSKGVLSGKGVLRIVFFTPPCAEPTFSGIRCMIAVRQPAVIAPNVDLAAQSYSWTVGNIVELKGRESTIGEGQYKIQICPVNSNSCDVSDAYFTISSTTPPTDTVPGVGPLNIKSPNGGENWISGSVRKITWTSPRYIRATNVDLWLLPAMPACPSGMMCAQVMPMPYKIVSGISANQNSYDWTVGQVIAPASINSNYMYAPAGQYKVEICETGTTVCDESDGYMTISGQNLNQAPIIKGIDAPTSLDVGETGTWTLRVTDPMNSTLSYQVYWGDEQAPTGNPGASVSSPANYINGSFTHSYSERGTYNVNIVVTNSSGQSAKTTTTVRVK